MKPSPTPEISPTRLSLAASSAKKDEVFSELNKGAQPPRDPLLPIPKLHFPSLDETSLRDDPNTFSIIRETQQLYPAPRETGGGADASPSAMKDLLVNKFIGEFTTDQSFKIIRGFINQNDSDRIFYTRFEPIGPNRKVNVLIIHGYGHSGQFLEVGSSAG